MSEKEETIPVTLRVPKALIQFLKEYKGCFDSNETIEIYFEHAIVDRVRADIDAEVFSPTVEHVAEKYGIKFDC